MTSSPGDNALSPSPIIVGFRGVQPRIHETAWIAPGAAVIGDVQLAAGVSVWFNSTIRGDVNHIEFGEGSNFQDGSAAHSDSGYPLVVGSGVSVGHNAVLHGCTIEDDSLIGMGAVVLNGAVIGAGSMVAAGAVVLQNTVVPPGSLVAGVPAKVRRQLTDEERESIVENARLYSTLMGDYE